MKKLRNLMPILFLVATFEHCYAILNLFNNGLVLPVITTILLVVAIDSSIYISMHYIDLLPAKVILGMSGTISVILNVKYMYDWKPAGTFASIIAITVGLLIPLMLSLFGWLEKAIRTESVSEINTKDVIQYHLAKFPGKSTREIAESVGCSHTTVRRYQGPNHKEETTR